jgi:hypothetical protein
MGVEEGWKDPAGIKVRPIEGLHGIDFLAHGLVVKDATYVFSHLIEKLSQVGYDNNNLVAAPVRSSFLFLSYNFLSTIGEFHPQN